MGGRGPEGTRHRCPAVQATNPAQMGSPVGGRGGGRTLVQDLAAERVEVPALFAHYQDLLFSTLGNCW